MPCKIKYNTMQMQISGETSAGKTILVNKILEKRVFVCENHESTSTICKIRNSDRIKVITETNAGKNEEDLTDKCDLSTEAGVAKLREYLERSTKIQPLQTDMYYEYQSGAHEEYQSVDVGLPIPFLPVKIFTILNVRFNDILFINCKKAVFEYNC